MVGRGSRYSPNVGSLPRRRRRMWCWTVSASCTNPISGAPSRGAPRSPPRTACSCCSITRSSRSSTQGQWNALRHGHFAYYSLTTLMYLLSTVGMRIATAWEFDLYGGTVLVAAVHGAAVPDETVQRILATEEALGVTNPDFICRLQHYADRHVDSLRNWLEEEAEAGRTVLGYGAASRAVALFSRAGLNADLLAAVADASPAKQGRRMPGTDIPIVSPDELLAAKTGSSAA